MEITLLLYERRKPLKIRNSFFCLIAILYAVRMLLCSLRRTLRPLGDDSREDESVRPSKMAKVEREEAVKKGHSQWPMEKKLSTRYINRTVS